MKSWAQWASNWKLSVRSRVTLAAYKEAFMSCRRVAKKCRRPHPCLIVTVTELLRQLNTHIRQLCDMKACTLVGESRTCHKDSIIWMYFFLLLFNFSDFFEPSELSEVPSLLLQQEPALPLCRKKIWRSFSYEGQRRREGMSTSYFDYGRIASLVPVHHCGHKWNSMSFKYFYISFIFYSSFIFTKKLSGKYRDFPYTPWPHTNIASFTTKSHTRAVHWLQLMNLH